jgi:outer membrane protein OmpA-like peptidoglycan-associated protein
MDARGKADEARLTQTEQLSAATAARIDSLAALAVLAPASPAATPHVQLLDAIAGVAIFFTKDDEFVNPDAANAHLEAIAAKLAGSGEGLRVVGYADNTGAPSLNVENSSKRAARVARLLIERGAPAGKVIAVARAAQTPIADANSPQHARNRRVTFGALLSDEPGP